MCDTHCKPASSSSVKVVLRRSCLSLSFRKNFTWRTTREKRSKRKSGGRGKGEGAPWLGAGNKQESERRRASPWLSQREKRTSVAKRPCFRAPDV